MAIPSLLVFEAAKWDKSDIVAIPLEVEETMTVGYVYHAERSLSPLAKRYLEKLRMHIEANPTVNTYYPYKQ